MHMQAFCTLQNQEAFMTLVTLHQNIRATYCGARTAINAISTALHEGDG